MISMSIIIAFLVVAVGFAVLSQVAVVVPQQMIFLVERLGRFSAQLEGGFHILIPFADVVRYRLSIKETALDIPEQICITKDNVQVGVDGVLYFKVFDPQKAAYGVSSYVFAITQLAQTTLRSEIGRIDLDKTFEERSHINNRVVEELDKATESWGVKVLRYEIKNINPPRDIVAAMEKQMRAEREKRASILTSEGAREAAINEAEGYKQKIIKESEAKKLKQVNEAQGAAAAILSIAEATAKGIEHVAEAIQRPGGVEAMQLRVAENYITEFGKLAQTNNTMIIPANVADIAGMVGTAIKTLDQQKRISSSAKV